MNHYRMSNGQKIAKSVIDRKVREAKQIKLYRFLDEHGFYFCEDCNRSDVFPIDCSHDISVDECQKTGRSELAFDVENIKLLCRACHQKKDGLNLKFRE